MYTVFSISLYNIISMFKILFLKGLNKAWEKILTLMKSLGILSMTSFHTWKFILSSNRYKATEATHLYTQYTQLASFNTGIFAKLHGYFIHN